MSAFGYLIFISYRKEEILKCSGYIPVLPIRTWSLIGEEV